MSATTPREDRITRQQRRDREGVYAFEPEGGGRGISLTCSTSSTNAAIPVGVGTELMLFFDGVTPVHVYLSTGSPEAAYTDLAIPPLTPYVINLPDPADDDDLVIAAITRSGTGYLQVSRGFGS